MKPFVSLLFLGKILLLAALILPAAASQSEAAGKDAWYRILLADQPCGYMHTSFEKVTKSGETVLSSKAFSRMNITRGAASLEISQRIEYLETEQKIPISCHSVMSLSNMDTITDCTFKDGLAYVVQNIGGQQSETKVEIPPNTILPSLAQSLLDMKQVKEGQKYQFKVFVPDMLVVTGLSLEIAGREPVKVMDKDQDAWKVRSTMEILPNIVSTEWTDSEGEILRSVFPMMGIDFVQERTTREEALKETKPAELLLSTIITPNKLLDNPSSVTDLTVILSGKSQSLALTPIDTPRQKTSAAGKGKFRIEVHQRQLPADFSLSELETQDVVDFLKPTSFIQSGDPEIQATAKLAVGDETSAPVIATKLTHWVAQNITEKDFRVGFASASETLKTREGDCSEHAVLLAALLRASGLPARVVSGIVYAPKMSGFLYHMWVEVWLNDWCQVDAAFDTASPDATHIKFAESSLDTSDLLTLGAELARLVANTDMEIVEVKTP